MRVGIDATGWADRRGIGRFTRNAVTNLVELDGDNDYVLYVGSEAMLKNGLPPRAQKRLLTPGGAARLRIELSREPLDAFVFPSVANYFPVGSVPTLVGVHEVPTSRRRRLAQAVRESIAVRRAARVFTTSVSARALVASRFGIPTAKLAVVPGAADPAFRPRGAAAMPVVDRLGLQRGRFLVYAGGLDPHKDIDTLLRAHAALCRRSDTATPLILAGELGGEDGAAAAARIRRTIAGLGSADSVLLVGFVPDEELAELYAASGAVAIPSRAESFGLPAVEAAACGAALVLSELPAHREILDGAAQFFEPGDAAALEARLAAVLADPGLRRQLGADARRRAAQLSWRAAGERLKDLVAEVARN
jgi:glycosyltransferase involved in cell wall biosynthesis